MARFFDGRRAINKFNTWSTRVPYCVCVCVVNKYHVTRKNKSVWLLILQSVSFRL